MSFLRTLALSLFVLAAAAPVPARAAAPSAEEIVKQSLETFYYAGEDMRAKVRMRLVNPQGRVREREMTMLRLNEGEAGNQRYYIYFHGPADVRSTTFMVWKYPGREDDRWIFVPAVRLVQRLAADDKRSSFVGSDFTYEDISGRELNEETHVVVGEEDLDGRPTYVVESTPKAAANYTRRVSWIDQERWIPLREEYFDVRDQPLRTFTADEVERIDGRWTVTARSMQNEKSRHRTEVVFQQVEYDVGLTPDIFSERYLRDAPGRWVR